MKEEIENMNKKQGILENLRDILKKKTSVNIEVLEMKKKNTGMKNFM